MKKTLFISLLGISLTFSACRSSARNYPVTFVDRRAVFAPDKKTNPLMLVVEISTDKKLNLNKIETGTLSDPAELTEKIKVIFNDREKSSIREREVIINPQGKIENGDLEKLVESLKSVKASPILVVKNEF